MQMTNTQIKEYVRRHIREIGPCTSLRQTHPVFFDFITTLLKQHTNPSRMDYVVDVGIKPNEVYGHLELFVLKKYMEKEWPEDISWHKCLGGKPKELYIRACRYEISSQIWDFKKDSEPICVQCGSTEKLHVDHIRPFTDILACFMEDRKAPTSFLDASGNQVSIEDRKWGEEWAEYHRTHATFQMLCAGCNLRKGARMDWVCNR